VALLPAICALALVAFFPGSTSAATVPVDIPGEIVVKKQLGVFSEADRCVAASFVEFSEHPGATRYVAHVLNSFYNPPREQEFSGPPFDDTWSWYPVQFTAPADKHWLFVSASSKGLDPNCTAESDQRANITLLSLQAEVDPENQPPTASFTWQAQSAEPLGVDFDGSGSSDPDAGDTITGYDWDFGDPDSGEQNTTDQAAPSHVFSGGGVYTVTLRVTSSDGTLSEPFAQDVRVASFTASTAQDQPLEALTVSEPLHYEGAGWDPDGGPIEVLWDDRVVATHPAATSFSGELATPDFAEIAVAAWLQGEVPCRARLSARQGTTERALDATGSLGEVVYWAANVQYEDGRPVQPQSVICRGTLLHSPDGTPFLYGTSSPANPDPNEWVCTRSEPQLLVTAGPFRPETTGDDRRIGDYEGLWIQYLSPSGHCFDTRDLFTNVLTIDGVVVPLPGFVGTDATNQLTAEGDVLLRPLPRATFDQVHIAFAGTKLTSPSAAGATTLEVASNDGFLGKVVEVGSGPTGETNFVDEIGSLILALPTRLAHAAGETVVVSDDTLYVGILGAQLELGRKADEARVYGVFALTSGVSASCPADVTFGFGPSSQTIAASAFKAKGPTKSECVYERPRSAAGPVEKIVLDFAKRRFEAKLRHELGQPQSPLEVTLHVGDAHGSESIALNPKRNGRTWTYRR
jgi:PKD repeat protein